MFHLKKWYLDCTTQDGHAFIAYWATVNWGAITLSYASLIHSAPDSQNVETSTTFRPGPAPKISGTQLAWSCPHLNLQGTWSKLCPGAERTLLEKESGTLKWSCLMPRSQANLTIRSKPYHGLGYVEHLEMTIAPWLLPIRELRWGQWQSPSTSLAWIDWRGTHPLSLILRDGLEVAGTISDNQISLNTGEVLSLDTSRIIRDGELGATVLRAIPGVSNLLPPALLRTHEKKWLSRGVLSPSNTPGHSIHECISFGLP